MYESEYGKLARCSRGAFLTRLLDDATAEYSLRWDARTKRIPRASRRRTLRPPRQSQEYIVYFSV